MALQKLFILSSDGDNWCLKNIHTLKEQQTESSVSWKLWRGWIIPCWESQCLAKCWRASPAGTAEATPDAALGHFKHFTKMHFLKAKFGGGGGNQLLKLVKFVTVITNMKRFLLRMLFPCWFDDSSASSKAELMLMLDSAFRLQLGVQMLL